MTQLTGHRLQIATTGAGLSPWKIDSYRRRWQQQGYYLPAWQGNAVTLYMSLPTIGEFQLIQVEPPAPLWRGTAVVESKPVFVSLRRFTDRWQLLFWPPAGIAAVKADIIEMVDQPLHIDFSLNLVESSETRVIYGYVTA